MGHQEDRSGLALIYLLLVCSMTLSGSGLYLLLETPEKYLLGWILVGLGFLLLIETIYYYATRKKDKCADCAYMSIGSGELDCDSTPDCSDLR